MVTLEDVRKNKEVNDMIATSSSVLEAMRYTEHGIRHASYVSRNTGLILQKLGYDDKTVELGKIAGYIHDVGNMINRKNHGISSALLIYPVLKEMGMDTQDICSICSALGNHEEEIGYVVNSISAALIIADKSDAHRTRVSRLMANLDSDIHDRVNNSIQKNIVLVDSEKKIISSKFYTDGTSSVMDYLKIFLSRILLSEKAAMFLGCKYRLYINDVRINN